MYRIYCKTAYSVDSIYTGERWREVGEEEEEGKK